MQIIIFSRDNAFQNECKAWQYSESTVTDDILRLQSFFIKERSGLLFLGPDICFDSSTSPYYLLIKNAAERDWKTIAFVSDINTPDFDKYIEAGCAEVLPMPESQSVLHSMLTAKYRHYQLISEGNTLTRNEILTAAGIVPWEFDVKNWQFSYIGQNIEKIIGYSAERWYSHDFSFKLVHPDDRKKVDDFFRVSIIRPGLHEISSRMLGSGGKVVWIRTLMHVDLPPLADTPTVSGIMMDITALQQFVEKQLKDGERAKNELEQHLNRAPLAVLQTDSDLKISTWSPGAEALIKRKEADVLGYQWSELGLIHPDDEPRVIEELLPLMNGQVRYQELRNRNICGDGSIVHMHWVNSCLRNPDGTIRSILSMGRDISNEINEAIAKQEAAKMDALITLSSGLAHDFNNLLTPILFHAEMIENDSAMSDEARRRGERVRKNAIRARQLISSLLNLNRPLSARLAPVNTADFIREITAFFQESQDNDISLIMDTSNAPVNFYADENLLHQAVVNLVTNSFHVVSENQGNIWLSIGINPERNKDLMITVKDDGPGILAEEQEEIFNPFFTTKPGEKGNGLGLAMVKRIAEAHNGTVELISRANKGAEFVINIPYESAEAEITAKTHTRVPRGDISLDIVLVEDELHVSEVIGMMLLHLGHKVTTYNDPLQALAFLKLESSKVDLIMSDQQMPMMTGLQLADALTQAGVKTPVVLLTGTSVEVGNQENAQNNITDVLEKPISFTEMAAFLNRFASFSVRQQSS